MDWQPIDTVPKDGRLLLLYGDYTPPLRKEKRYFFGHWEDATGWISDLPEFPCPPDLPSPAPPDPGPQLPLPNFFKPTHWIALTPPKEEA